MERNLKKFNDRFNIGRFLPDEMLFAAKKRIVPVSGLQNQIQHFYTF